MEGGAKDAGSLAWEAGAEPGALFRVLRAPAAVGVPAMDGSNRFSLTALGHPLRSDGAHSLSVHAAFNGDQCYPAWGEVLPEVTTGETPFDRVFGVRHLKYLPQRPEASATFYAAMASSSRMADDPFQGYRFAGHRVVVDVGGGRGARLGHILKENPGLRGIIFDLPAAVSEAPQHLASLGVADRCEIGTGSPSGPSRAGETSTSGPASCTTSRTSRRSSSVTAAAQWTPTASCSSGRASSRRAGSPRTGRSWSPR